MSEYTANFFAILGLSLILLSGLLVSALALNRTLINRKNLIQLKQRNKLSQDFILNSLLLSQDGAFKAIEKKDHKKLARVFASLVAFLDEDDVEKIVIYARKNRVENSLIKLLKSNDEEDRIMACKALKYFRNRASALINTAQNDNSQRVRVEAILSLENSYRKPHFETWSQWLAFASANPNVAFKTIIANKDLVGLRTLGKMLLYSNCDEIMKIWLLDEIAHRSPNTANSIIAKLIDSKNINSKAMQKALLRNNSSVKILVDNFSFYVNSPLWEVREAFCKSASTLLAFELLENVMGLIYDKDYRVHSAAVNATKILAGIGENPDPRVIRRNIKSKQINKVLNLVLDAA